MALFEKRGGFMDVIRCDEPSYLIWKWRPMGAEQKNAGRENAIRWGSRLRVKDGEVAVFVYPQQNNVQQDFIVGPFDQTIKTANFPVLASIVGLAYEGESPFQAEIYFINLAKIIQMRFVIPFFDVYDPSYPEYAAPVALRGTISYCIADYREFVRLHRLIHFSLTDFEGQIKDAVCRYIKQVVINAPRQYECPVVQIESKIGQINEAAEQLLAPRLSEDFGVKLSGLDIASLDINKAADGYVQLLAITRDLTTAKKRAEALDYVEQMRIRREEGQYAMHKATQSTNLEAYRIEKQTQVGMAGAQALGQMGENGAGGVALGAAAGFHPAAMMAGLTLGGAVGQNLGGVINDAFAGKQQSAPPSPPTVAFYAAQGGRAIGPYEPNAVLQMIAAGQVTAQTLLWCSGMANWCMAKEIETFRDAFGKDETPPPLPQQAEDSSTSAEAAQVPKKQEEGPKEEMKQ